MSECGRPDCLITDLHTHQAGTDGIIGQVCKHGSLARSCYICELEAERDAWKQRCQRLVEALKKNMDWIGCPPTGPYTFDSQREDAWSLGKEALKEFENAR